MNLPAPISATFNGREVTITKLAIVLVDDSTARTVQAHIRPFPRPLTLWSGEAYDQIGDYTQAQAEARISEMLGQDIAAGLSSLA